MLVIIFRSHPKTLCPAAACEVSLRAKSSAGSCRSWFIGAGAGPRGQSHLKLSGERRHAEMKAGFKLALKLRGVRDRMPPEPQQETSEPKPRTSCTQLFVSTGRRWRQSDGKIGGKLPMQLEV